MKHFNAIETVSLTVLYPRITQKHTHAQKPTTAICLGFVCAIDYMYRCDAMAMIRMEHSFVIKHRDHSLVFIAICTASAAA